MSTYTKYPNSLDDSDSILVATDDVTPVEAEIVNRIREAVIAVESELGTQPSGTFSTVRARLDSLELLLSGDVDTGTLTLTNVLLLGNETGGSNIIFTGTDQLQWDSTANSPTIKQNDDTNNSVTGDTLTVQAQNTTGLTTTGGKLVLKSGTGTLEDGYIEIRAGSNIAVPISPGTATSYSGANAGDYLRLNAAKSGLEYAPLSVTQIFGPSGQATISGTMTDGYWTVIGGFYLDVTPTEAIFSGAALSSKVSLTTSIRIYDTVAAAAVTGSTLNTSSSTDDRLVSADISSNLTVNRLYQFQAECVGGTAGDDFGVVRFAVLKCT